MDVFAHQLSFDFFQHFSTFLLQLNYPFGNGGEQLGSFNPTQCSFPRFFGLCNAFNRGITHLEKFVEVVGENPHKAKTLNKGNVWVGGFLQDPCVEVEPA